MARFDRYVLSQLMVLWGFFSLVLVSVYWINRAVILFDQLIADGQSSGTFLTFTILTLPNVIRLVLPISAFVAAVYVTNRLTTESELVVAQATGLSPARMARAVMAFGLLVALLMAVLVHVLVPASRTQLSEREDEIAANVTARLLKEGQFLHPADGITFYVREITPDAELRDVFLSDARDEGQGTVYLAERAYLARSEEDRPRLVMFDGQAQTLDEATGRLRVTRFEDFAYDVSTLMDGGGSSRRDVREFPTTSLFAPSEADLAAARRDVADFRYEGHLRMVAPFTPLIAALLGYSALMLGGFSRFGVWRQIGLAVVLIVLYQIGENAAADVARRDASAWPAVYAPPAAGFAAAAIMLALGGRSSIFRRRPKRPGVAPA
ncbi:LPS export ABC transporter permease LptF [Roseicyclus sp. F158]|uniref:LPS export ABC transporter permease LptF n=1 Tax=Tropicimonas omnivorans TaxID=3075590 RepID=A0ABU3DE33_9RHOB|nr:LPS export ABC transporter permease LptF [Roseicyclus sp. F158]MDT0681969.1 LPS export ABC transporter permease LptF [Roseicyclus sp. F158]